jgi:tRNA-uridine 2-sulfurtransferase
MTKKAKALVLFSGGLDSQLVIKILQEQKIEIVALHFILPFGAGCCSDQKCIFNFSQVTGVKLRFVDCTQGENFQEYLEFVKKPKFGHGAGINPCIDCRIFILKKAKELMKKLECDFIATGEVLGERPMSQHLRALKLIEKETGLEGNILRPLSAKLFPETEAEKNGLVNRKKLYDISGRRRVPQMDLAKKYGLKNYPSPAGGCLLCEKEFAKRFKQMLENFNNLDENNVELLKLGRHFWSSNNLIIIGRNQEENKKLEQLAQKADIIIELIEVPGPTALIRGKIISEETIQKTKDLIKKYSSKLTNQRHVNFNQRQFS